MTAVVAAAQDVGVAWRIGGVEMREKTQWDDMRIKALATAAMLLLGRRNKKEHGEYHSKTKKEAKSLWRRSRLVRQSEVSEMFAKVLHFLAKRNNSYAPIATHHVLPQDVRPRRFNSSSWQYRGLMASTFCQATCLMPIR